MKILVTGANGFIGKNLSVRLNEIENVDLVTFTRDQSTEELCGIIDDVELGFSFGWNQST